MKYTVPRHKRGMTLVEILVALAIVTIGIVSLVTGVTQMAVYSKRVDMGYTATNLAVRRVEVLKRLDYDMLPLAEEDGVRVDVDGNINSDGQYFRTTEIEEDFNGNSYLTKVKVSVRKLKLNPDGSVPTTLEYQGATVVMETIFADT